MPRNIDLNNMGFLKPLGEFSRKEFIKQQKEKSRKSRRGKVKYRNLIGRRSINLVIRESAAGEKYMVIKYRKQTTNETKTYKIAPYSFRYKMSKKTNTRKKVLMGYDFKERHIKSFYISNIKSIKRTDSRFTPKWPVEIKF